jgi:ribosomal-protein-alanine N-acetyltransferase
MTEPQHAFQIRRATEADRPAIMEVLRSANMHHVPSAEMPELDLACCGVAEAEGRIVGMGGYKIMSGTEAKTTLMAVLPSHRGWGIGNALQSWRMKELLEKGIRLLTTNADRPETISWYKKHFGYREIGTLAKLHEFGHPGIARWTTLQVNLFSWGGKNVEHD